MKQSFFHLFLLLCLFSFILSKPHSKKSHPFEEKVQSVTLPKSILNAGRNFQTAAVYYEDLSKNSNSFTGPVTFGGSDSVYRMVFDTTSEKTWVVSDFCADPCLSDQTNYPKLTCKDPSCEYIPNYLASAVTDVTTNGLVSSKNNKFTGYEATDSIKIAGLQVTRTKLYLGKSVQTPKNLGGQGVVSLSYSDNSIIKAYKNDQKIEKAQFSFFFSEKYNIFTFGGKQSFFSMEDFTNYDVIKANAPLWTIGLYKTYLNSAEDAELLSSVKEVSFDSTLDGIAVPTDILTKINTKFTSALSTCKTVSNLFSCGCTQASDINKLPTLGLSFGNNKRIFTLAGKDYAEYKEIKSQSGIVTQTYCEVKIYGDAALTRWNLGKSFLKPYYVNFDHDNSLIEIASVYNQNLDHYIQPDESRITVIVVGIVIALVSILALFVILKPVPYSLYQQDRELKEY